MVFNFRAAIIVIGLLAQVLIASGQTYVGLSFDYGNAITVAPETKWVSSPNMPSGSLFLHSELSFLEVWKVQYGISIGVSGRSIKVRHDFDTIVGFNYQGMHIGYPEYGTIYLSPHLALGREMRVGHHTLSILLGGGISYYKDFFEVSGTLTMIDQGQDYEIFSYTMKQRDSKVLGFAEAGVWYPFNHWASLGLRYRHYFSHILEGSYQLFHVENPPQGNLKLYPHYISLMLAAKLK